MNGSLRSVMVRGRPVTWATMVEAVGDERAALCPVDFTVAKSLPISQARALEAWLRRQGVDASLRKAVLREATLGKVRHRIQPLDSRYGA